MSHLQKQTGRHVFSLSPDPLLLFHPTGASEPLPVLVPFPAASDRRTPFITAISCGGTFNLAVTSKNEVYTWGFGEMGQLGHKPPKGKEPADEPLPRPIDFSHTVEGVNAFEVLKADGGAQHSVILARVPVAYLDEVKRKYVDVCLRGRLQHLLSHSLYRFFFLNMA